MIDQRNIARTSFVMRLWCVRHVRKRYPLSKMTSRTDRLLCCAVAYCQADIEPSALGEVSSDVEGHIGKMMNVLWFEAKESMSKPIDVPSDPYLHAVDIDSSEPGIVSSKGKLDIYRRKLPIPKVGYRHRTPAPKRKFENSLPSQTLQEAIEAAEKQERKLQKQVEKKAARELKSEKSSLEKIEKRENEKKKRQEETPEERQARLEENREKRRLNKERKEEERRLQQLSSHSTEQGESNETEESSPTSPPEEEQSLQDGQNISLNVQELLEAESEADVSAHAILPPRIKAKTHKTKFFPSPVPYDRHLAALEAAWPAEHVKNAFLEYKTDERIQVIQGPPGTGKTTELLRRLDNFPTQRILLCAATNVGAANLYTRAINMGYHCSLLMPMSRIPGGTPIASQDPDARIVCSTISGRAGPVLDCQDFSVLLVDEAAQCMEAWFWGLIRPEVQHIIMVGDTEQLPALVSETGQSLGYDQSLMERLVKHDYPVHQLITQRRMHPEIAKFPNDCFYQGRLSTDYKPDPAILAPPYHVYEVQGTCKEVGTSFVNKDEIDVCVKKALEYRSMTDDVVILCPYQAQARQMLSAGSGIPIHTIDSFQGREADVVVLSVVRTDKPGFWSDKRRLCVALTRAKHCLCIVGYGSVWSGCLKHLYENAQSRGCLTMCDNENKS